MNKTYFKNILKDIKNTKGKVASIAIMVGLAALVVVALTLTGPSMRKSLDNSLKTYGHPDMIVRSTYGLDFEDEAILDRDADIKTITRIKTADLVDDETLIRLKSYNDDLKKAVITEGDFPKETSDIILSSNLSDKYKIGDEIHFSYIENAKIDDEPMKNLTYKVVGFMKTSDFFMEDMREISFVAKKELNGYAYVLEENFDTDKYGEINITYKDSENLDKTTNDYLKFVDQKQEKIENALANRPKEVLDNIKKDTRKDLDDAQAEIDDAKVEISDAEKKLQDARKDLDQGYIDYENGKKEFDQKIADGQIKLENSRADLVKGQNELDAARLKYQNNLSAYNDKIQAAESELKANEEKLTIGQAEVDKGQKEIDEGYEKLEAEFAKPRQELKVAKEKLDATKAELDSKKAELESLEAEFENLDPDENIQRDLPENINTEELQDMKARLEAGFVEYEKGLAEYQSNKDDLENRYASEKAKIDSGREEINQKQEELNAGFAKLEAGKNELTNSRISGQKALDNAKAQIDQNQVQIDNGWEQYNAGVQELENQKANGQKELEDSYRKLLDGEDEYQENLEKFEKEKSDANNEISDGEDEISDAKDTLARLVDPEYDVESIRDNEGINTYYQNSLNMDELTKVFPTFFYLVAMLVTLTTMKRFIEEQRTINGTLKALGYSNKQISQRFYLYGIIPTLIGSIIGAIIGRFVVADVIIKAYSSGFGNLGIDYVNALPYIIFAVILSSLLVALTVYFSSKETVKETPAALLRPKAPDPGKKILLEKIEPIWKKMSFLQKITSRNLFRYKSRMFMTLFGVGGCTALTFFGFAMIDSIKDTVTWQQEDINHYDVIAMVDEKSTNEQLESYNKKIKNYEYLDIKYDDAKITNNGKTIKLSLVIPKENEDLDNFVSLKNLNRKTIDLSKEKAVITEKAADKLGISIGDKISFTYENKEYFLPISNIAENYTGNFIYLSKDSFENITGQTPKFNANYLKGDPSQMIKSIENEKAVNAIINASIIYASMDVLLANLNLVIGVITIISILLALVVLYNLININVSERKRELATIKVLGFYPKEVTSYIFREIFILTIFGIFVGFGLGYAMFRYIIYVVAPEDILLSYRVHFNSFLYSGLITLAISIALLFIVHKNLKKIDMAEAMSSGE